MRSSQGPREASRHLQISAAQLSNNTSVLVLDALCSDEGIDCIDCIDRHSKAIHAQIDRA